MSLAYAWVNNSASCYEKLSLCMDVAKNRLPIIAVEILILLFFAFGFYMGYRWYKKWGRLI